MSRHSFPVLLAALLLISTSLAVAADDGQAVDWQPYFRELARSYRMATTARPDEPLTLHEPPVLRSSQPVRGGELAWAPRTGIEWKAFDEAPPPAPTPKGRLAQMRQLANRFRGENVDDAADRKWELRLLRQPLFRWDQSERTDSPGPVLDGALFTLASGTDPEILIEARTADDSQHWHWALARFSDRPLTAWLDDQQVWSVERARPNATSAHTFFDVERLVRPPQSEERP